MKTAIVLLALGGPLKEGDIRPFLFNFFMDKNIIAAPLPVRYLIAQYISRTRSKGAAHEAYGRLGFKSPLLENTQAQASALQFSLSRSAIAWEGKGVERQELSCRTIPSPQPSPAERERGQEEYRAFVALRYWHPFADETVREVKAWGADNLILLPMYPQYSTTTTKSALEDWARAAEKTGLALPTRAIESWHLNDGFIGASADLIKTALAGAPPNTRLLFSAHGLPEKIIAQGDPYQGQCEETAAGIVKEIKENLDWSLCYQSRVGPLKWIGPSTEEELKRAGREGKGVVVYPLAFVCEHVETLVEIEIEYREKAARYGIPYFARVPTVSTHPLLIKGLADIIRRTQKGMT